MEGIWKSRNPKSANIFTRTQDLTRAAASNVGEVHAYPIITLPSSSVKRILPGYLNWFSRKKSHGGSLTQLKMLPVALFLKQEVGKN